MFQTDLKIKFVVWDSFMFDMISCHFNIFTFNKDIPLTTRSFMARCNHFTELICMKIILSLIIYIINNFILWHTNQINQQLLLMIIIGPKQGK